MPRLLGRCVVSAVTEEQMVNLEADLADVIHTARVHATSGVCHGDNEGCRGGPEQPDYEAAEDAMGYVTELLRTVGVEYPAMTV